MIIKSVIRGGYRSAAEYMQEQGKNETTRLVEISDPSAKNLDDAFHNMWVVAANTKCTKPLHHISINPMPGERLTDAQLRKIVEHCEEVFGYKMFHHQRVIVEHIKDGRQHFHVIWNRVSLVTGKAVWPGKDWEKAKQICRTMEKALGLKSPTPRPKGHKGKTTLPKKERGKSRSAKGAKHRRGVKHGRSHTSPHSNAGVLTMLNRISRHKRKGKTSGSSSSYRRGSSDFVNNPAWMPHPVMLPKIILFIPSPQPTPQPAFFRPRKSGGWPEAAITDWATWGHRNPPRFFALWPELS
jgi:hypothetical protein